MGKKTLVVAAMAVGFLFQLVPAWGAPPLPNKDMEVTTGVPQWAATPQRPMVIYIKRLDPNNNTKTIYQKVTINNLPKYTPPPQTPFVRPAVMAGDTVFTYNARVQAANMAWIAANQAAQKAAWEAASKAKADTIAAAINDQLGAGTATSGVGPPNPDTGYVPGQFTVSDSYGFVYGRGTNTTGEVGDGVKVKDGAGGGGGTLPYSCKATIGSPSGANPGALGVDPNGGPSIVEFGITGVDIASWFPNPGDTIDAILQNMQTLLESNATFTGDGYSAVYDPTAETLTMSGGPDGNFDDGTDQVYFSMDDINLDGELGVTYGIVGEPMTVPEPASLALFAGGAAALLLKRRRRS